MVHLDLFSGIGGFAYAADQVWDNVTHVFCDNEPFAQAVLQKHWPEAYIYGDIRDITADSERERLEGQPQDEAARHPAGRGGAWQGQKPFILTGGFPCQPFSAAGLRRGTADDRHLWPEMLRVIRLARPAWVIAENVGGILTWNEGLVFEQVCADLEAAGYEVQPFVIPAVAVNAPHRRDRVWFVGHAEHDGLDGSKDRKGADKRSHGHEAGADEPQQPARPDSLRHAAADAGGERRQPGRGQGLAAQTSERWQGVKENQRPDLPDWGRDWIEATTEFCSVDDGLPARLGGLELSKPQHRKEQLKAYGNAIVPQVAMEIMAAIKQAS